MQERDVYASPGRPRPFLRWAGGKRWATPAILRLTPDCIGTYFEPFLGGGAMLFALQPRRASVSDLNDDLVTTYATVRDHPEDVIEGLLGLGCDRRTFGRVKRSEPRASVDRAVRLIYLNRASWNGLYRVNSSGQFNVPYGRRRPFTDSDAGVIRMASRVLQPVSISQGDFETSVTAAGAGDLVFLDPPYTVTHGDNGFLLYNENIFSWADQERLARVARSLAERGVHVVVTNASHSSILDLYQDFRVLPLYRNSILAADPNRRREVSELLITNLH